MMDDNMEYDIQELEEKVQEELDYAQSGWYTPGTSYYP